MKIVKKLKKVKMNIFLSSVCKHANKIQRYKAQHFQLVVKGGGGMVVGEILGGMKGILVTMKYQSLLFFVPHC